MYTDFDLKVIGKISEILFHEPIGDLLRKRRAYEYLKRYVHTWQDKENKFLPIPVKNGVSEHTIWIAWFQGLDKAPELVQACVKSVRKYAKNDVVLITNENIHEYVQFPDYIEKKRQNNEMSMAHYADLLRLYLLAAYGGCWIDATVLCFESIPSAWMESEFFCLDIPDYGREFKIGCNWFLIAQKGHPIISDMLNIHLDYWKKEKRAVHYFFFHMMFKQLITSVPEYNKIFMDKIYFEVGNTHRIRYYMNDPYDPAVIEKMKTLAPMQKVSYKKKYNTDKNSMYSRIIHDDVV